MPWLCFLTEIAKTCNIEQKKSSIKTNNGVFHFTRALCPKYNTFHTRYDGDNLLRRGGRGGEFSEKDMFLRIFFLAIQIVLIYSVNFHIMPVRCLWSGSKIEFSTLGKKVTDQCKWRWLSVHSRIYICYTSAEYAIESIRISFFFILFLFLSILDHHNVSIIARLVLKQTSIYFSLVVSCRVIEIIFILILLKWFFGYFFPFWTPSGLRPESPLTL